MTLIYHITTVQEIERAARVGKYLPASFEVDGFIHCAYSNQLRSVAEAKFRGKADLALLEIDSSRLDCPVVEGDATFPHIHGPLPMEAVTAIRNLSIPESGSFELPCNVDV
jgi:uncharacterized protein (DUF952 family)